MCESQKLLGFVRRLSRYIQSTQTRRTLYLSIVRCHLGYATQVWSPQSIGLLKRVENIQRRTTKPILKLPFRCDVTDETRLQLTNLLPISYWHEFLVIVFFYKAVNNLVFIDSEALPVSRQFKRSTRSSSSSAITYIPKRSRTVTYRRSFFIRVCRTHGTPRTNHIFLASFKSLLLQYYKRLWNCTTLTTLEPGEQSVLGATQRGLSYAHQHAASSNLDFLFVSSEFSAYILVDLVIKYFLYK